MPKSNPTYPRKFRRRVLDLVRAWRTPEALSREFEPLAAGLRGMTRRKGTRMTIRGADGQVIPDLVKRNFLAAAPNRLWIAKISTYIPACAGFLYLAVVIDAFPRVRGMGNGKPRTFVRNLRWIH